MSTQQQASIDDLYRTPGKAELVGGKLVLMSPTGMDPARAAFKIAMALFAYEQHSGWGMAVPDNAGFLVNLPHRQSFSPDAAYFAGFARGMRYFPGPPVFAVEVRSEHDYGTAAEQALAAKRADYFAAGTQVVWDVDLQSPDVVRVYRAADPTRPALYHRGDRAEAEPAVPGWTMPVDDLFPS